MSAVLRWFPPLILVALVLAVAVEAAPHFRGAGEELQEEEADSVLAPPPVFCKDWQVGPPNDEGARLWVELCPEGYRPGPAMKEEVES